jgi:serine protease Do
MKKVKILSSSQYRRLQGPLLALIAFCSLAGGGIMLSDVVSHSSAVASTLTTPPPKPAAQAAHDLKQSPPLDPTKLGDPLPRNLFVELSKLINPAVVSITTTQVVHPSANRYRDPLQDFMEEFWGGRGGAPQMAPQQHEPMMALGTGFIIREDGLIITNNHVVEQADIIKVQLAEGEKSYEAEVIGRDARTDIALIKIDAKHPLPVAPLGSSKEVQVGEWVAAFGNPYGHSHTMTKGIVSALGREIGEINRFPFIQTDASINPGNSGGPLVNTYGKVIGVNTAIDARAQGIGFAIPIDNVKDIVGILEKDGRIKRGYIGVNIASVTPEIAQSIGLEGPEGVVVTQIRRGSPADKAGLQPYDIILTFGGKKVADAPSLQNAVADTKIGDSAKVSILRFDQNQRRRELSMNVKVVENPEESRKLARSTKKYFGQNAPFDLGFKIADLTPNLAAEYNLDAEAHGPVVTEVVPGGPAAQSGLQSGDVVLDVNRETAAKATDVLRLLKKGRNSVRIIRGNAVAILPLGK